MKRPAVLCVLFVALAVVGGCASDSPDGLVKQLVVLVNEEAEAHEKNAPKSTLEVIKAKQKIVEQKWKALKLSEEEQKKIIEPHRGELEKAANRLLAAT